MGELHGPHDGPPCDHEKRERWGGAAVPPAITTTTFPSPRPWVQHQLWPSHQHHHPSLLLALGSRHHCFPVVSVGVGGHVKPKSKREEEEEERGDGLVVGGSSTVFTPRKAHRSPSSVLALGNQASRSDPFFQLLATIV